MSWIRLIFLCLYFSTFANASGLLVEDLNRDKVADLALVQNKQVISIKLDKNFDKKWDYEVITSGPTQMIKILNAKNPSVTRVIHQMEDKTLFIEIEGPAKKRVAKVWQVNSQPMKDEENDGSEVNCNSHKGIVSVIKNLAQVAKNAGEESFGGSCSTLPNLDRKTLKDTLDEVFNDAGSYCLSMEMMKFSNLAPSLIKAFEQLSNFESNQSFFECRKDIEVMQSTVPPMKVGIPLDKDGTLPLNFKEKQLTHEFIHLMLKQSCHIEQKLQICEQYAQNEKLVNEIYDRAKSCRDLCNDGAEKCKLDPKDYNIALFVTAEAATALPETQGAPLATIALAAAPTENQGASPTQIPLSSTDQRGEAISRATLAQATRDIEGAQPVIEQAVRAVGEQVVQQILPQAEAATTQPAAAGGERPAAQTAAGRSAPSRDRGFDDRERIPTNRGGLRNDNDRSIRTNANLEIDDRPLQRTNPSGERIVTTGTGQSRNIESLKTPAVRDAEERMITPAVRDRLNNKDNLETPAVRDRNESLKTPAVRDREAAQAAAAGQAAGAASGSSGGAASSPGTRRPSAESAPTGRDPAATPRNLEPIDPASLQGRPALEIARLIENRQSPQFKQFEQSLKTAEIAIIPSNGTNTIGNRRTAKTCYVMPTLLSLNWTNVPSNHPDLKKTLTKIKCGD